MDMRIWRGRSVCTSLFPILVLLLSTVGSSEAFKNSVFIQGVRPMSMGGAFAAVADDENLLFFNPAGLQNIEESRLTLIGFTFSFNVDTIRMWNRLPHKYWQAEKWQSIKASSIKKLQKHDPLINVSNANLIHITYVRPDFAFSLLNSELNAELDFDHNGSESVVLLEEQLDVLAMLSYCKRIVPGLSVGGTLRWMGQQQIEEENMADLIGDVGRANTILGITLSTDIGALYHFQSEIPELPLTAGVSAQNLIGAQLIRSKLKLETFEKVKSLSRKGLDRTFIFGLAYQPNWKFISPYFPEALTFAADIGGLKPILHLGMEMKAFRWLSFRAGVHSGLSIGIGLEGKTSFLDVMYSTRLKDPFLNESVTNNFAVSFMLRY